MIKNSKKILIFFLLSIFKLFANEIPIVVDSEIESFLQDITKPILISAGLTPQDITFYLVNDDNINAFVSGGQNIFVNLGDFTHFDTPEALLGILAHEIGHIAGGHLSRFSQGMKNATTLSIATILAGVGAVLSGMPEFAQFILMGGIGAGQQNLLQFTRNQESGADAMAVQYLHENNMSASALLVSMNRFYKEQLNLPKEMEYFATHPLSRNRMEFLKEQIEKEKHKNNNEFNRKEQNRFDYIKAKILAYNGKPIVNLKGNYLKYANAIKNNSLSDINYLLEKEPQNPYFYEVKGDINLKKGNIVDAIENYNKVSQILKNSLLIKKTMSFIIVKYKQERYYNLALEQLNYIILKEGNDYTNYKLLAELYYAMNNKEKSDENLKKYNEIKKEIMKERE